MSKPAVPEEREPKQIYLLIAQVLRGTNSQTVYRLANVLALYDPTFNKPMFLEIATR